MAKKKEKGAKKKADPGPRDAVLSAVEGTFQRAAGGVQELLDEVTAVVGRLREANVLETIGELREEVRALNERVAALEAAPKRAAPPKPATPRASTARRAATARRTAAAKPAPASGPPASRKKPPTGGSV